MKFLTHEVKIALVAIAAIVILFFGLEFLKGRTMFSSNQVYFACFDDVSGLTESIPIYANGYKVGVVDDISYDFSQPDRVIVSLGIDPKLSLPKGSVVEIVSDMLGNVKLELKLGENPLDKLMPGDTIKGGIQKGMLGRAGDMVPQIEAMLPKLDSILSSINALLANPALANTLHNVDQTTAYLATTSKELNQLTATLGKQVPQMMTTANGVLTNTEGLTRQFSEIDVAGTMQKVDATLLNVQQMTTALNSKEGTLGLLLHDPSLYNNLSNTMFDADQLMIDFKQHPKRYIHFSVFGKKDK